MGQAMTSVGSNNFEDKKKDYPGWGMDGRALHGAEGVPPETWCITRADLRYLRKEIRRAVRDGVIKQTERDTFDPKDNVHGPNMYTVVDHFIKPLTHAAGDMSWALLRHPDGLKCDVFITHCWAEGAYEFIDKVLASWPTGKRGAWCCIFANPQNLDISSLIGEPRNSPFAKALKKASHMMVVPTKQCSIYSRIWCVYEAYLAMTLGKQVFTASRPTVWANIMVFVFFAVGLIVSHGWFAAHSGHDGFRMCVLDIAMILAPLVCGLAFTWRKHSEMVILRRDVSSVTEAKSTSAIDKQKILAEIGSDVAAVDKAVKLLMNLGMFSPEFCKARELGVQFNGIANPAFPWIMMTCWLWSLTYFMTQDAPWPLELALPLLNLIAVIDIARQFRTQDTAGKAFIHSVLIKFGILITLSKVLVEFMGYWSGHSKVSAHSTFRAAVPPLKYGFWIVATHCAITTAFLSRAGVVGTTERLGPRLAGALAPGAPGCCFGRSSGKSPSKFNVEACTEASGGDGFDGNLDDEDAASHALP